MPKALADLQPAGKIGAESTRIKLNDGDVGPHADLGHHEIQPTRTAFVLAPVPAERFDLKSPVLSDAEFKAQVEALAQEIEHLERTAIFKIALHLAKAHELFLYRRDEGGFQGWVERRLGYSRSHAYRALDVARLMQCIPGWETFGTLPLTAIYQIAASSTPEVARAEILGRVKAGERLSCTAIDETIAKAKDDSKPHAIPDDGSIPEWLKRVPVPSANDPKAITAERPTSDNNASTKSAPEPATESVDEDRVPGEQAETTSPAAESNTRSVRRRVKRASSPPAIEDDVQTSGEKRKADNARLSSDPENSEQPNETVSSDKTIATPKASPSSAFNTWVKETPEEQATLIIEGALARFFMTVSGAEIYRWIPASRHDEICVAFLDALTVERMCAVMSPSFGERLRARVPSPESKLWGKDASVIALAIEAELGAVKAAAIGKKLSKLATPNAKTPGPPSNSTKPPKHKMTMPQNGVDEAPPIIEGLGTRYSNTTTPKHRRGAS